MNENNSQGPKLGMGMSVAVTAHNMQAAVSLAPGSVYPATVTNVYMRANTASVMIKGTVIDGVIYANGITGSMLGFRDIGMPTIGSTVLVLYGKPYSYIIGTLAAGERPVSGFYGALSGDLTEPSYEWPVFLPESKQDAVQADEGTVLPNHDLMPGEKEVTAGTGPFLRLLFSLAQLGAGDLARVEACMFNDMVRIVDNCFVHHTCGGDELVWSDGHCNSQKFFTSYQHEADGKKEDSDKFAGEESDIPNLDEVEDEFNDTGRWRVSEFKGYLADLISIMVHDPTKAASHYDKEGTALGGKARMWVGANGMVMVQSCSAVHVEVAPKVVVPTQKYSWNHPDRKNVDRQMEELNNDYLKLWGNGPDWDDLKVACWQLQSYAKYITLWQSLARFRQSEDADEMFKVPTESEAKEPRPDCDDERPGGEEGYGGYACLTMDGSGSITLCANGTTTVTMNQGNVQVACPGDFEIKAGGTVSITGANVAVSAAKRLELSSLGGLWIRARNWLYALCEKGRVWIKSDANDAAPENNELGDLEQPAKGHFGVIIDSAASGALVHGHTGATVAVTGGGAKHGAEAEHDLVLENSTGHVKISACRDIHMWSSNYLYMHCSALVTSASRFLADLSLVRLCKDFLVMAGGIFMKGTVMTDTVLAHSVTSDSGPYVGKTPDSYDSMRDKILDGAAEDSAKQVLDEFAAMPEEDFKYDVFSEELDNFEWRFDKWQLNQGSANEFKSLKTPLYELKTSWSQDVHEIDLSGKVTLSKLKPQGGSRTASSFPSWPGQDAKMYKYTDGSGSLQSLGEDWSRQYEESDIGGLSKMSPEEYSFSYNKDRE